MNLKVNRFRGFLCDFIFLTYLIGLVFIPIDLHVTNKIINTVGFISFFLLFSERFAKGERNIFILFIGLIMLGALDLTWYEFYKNNDVIYRNAYRGYLEAGKMLVFSSFTFLLLSKNHVRTNIKFHLIAAILTQLIVFSRAFYQNMDLNAARISLSAMNGNIGQMGAATIAAYVITFCSLYASILFIKLDSKYKWFLFYINFALTCAAIVMTGTRAAIITYPLLIVVILFIQHRDQKIFLAKGLTGVLALLLACGVLFSKEIEIRISQFKSDVITYTTQNNSVSSVGARFSMIQAGINGAPKGLEWQSLETRADNIKTLSKENRIYAGATEFLGVHMHNEIVEALSTKGIFGVVVLLFFYVTLIYYCLIEKKLLLVVFPISIILFGLSDVITHDKPIPAAWIVCLFLSISLLSKKEEIK